MLQNFQRLFHFRLNWWLTHTIDPSRMNPRSTVCCLQHFPLTFVLLCHTRHDIKIQNPRVNLCSRKGRYKSVQHRLSCTHRMIYKNLLDVWLLGKNEAIETSVIPNNLSQNQNFKLYVIGKTDSVLQNIKK